MDLNGKLHANFSYSFDSFGAQRYKELYWECGMIGQQLYLEATSLGLSGAYSVQTGQQTRSISGHF